MTDNPSGTIAFCSREDHVSPLFASALASLIQQHPDAELVHCVGSDVANMRNQAVAQALGEWIWFIDTDMVFAPDTLDRLLAHNVPVVQALCLMRHPPHAPHLYEHEGDGRGTLSGEPRLLEVHSVGAGGTLYRKSVFETIAAPWFEGVIGQEDLALAAKCRAAGIKLYTDLATQVGHLTPITVWPLYVGNGEWEVRYSAMNGKSVRLKFAE